ncbi:sensor histidine kinase [Marinoscillum pacificum]|uniref:sensor histidine kinase n=1 Tax=Marinoscillum pacificum TaxID=392723 RepID=UPI0021572A7F|nr:HAMP domain-containing sensor histidine kinase [Marinoscillum pacificum]
MKLIVKITFFFMLIASLVFVVGAMFSYNAMSREITLEERYFLEERLQSAIRYLERRMPTEEIRREKLIITPLDSTAQETEPMFSDTLVTHITLQRIEPHSKLDVVKKINDKAYYKITLYDLVVEEDDIKDAVQESMVKTYLLLFVVTLVLSLIASFYVFGPFQKTLDIIRNFSVKHEFEEFFPNTSTSEFKKLNQFIINMMRGARKDYLALKEFSENASHEIQTPLSIAQGKLELLMESNDELTEEQMELISSALYALKRLSKLGNSLSLLTKIENQEFSDFSSVDMTKLVSRFLFDFKELVELKEIKMFSEVSPDVQVAGNLVLLELLVTNLLNNAVRHNHSGGEIYVRLMPNKLEVKNTGEALKVDANDIFNRFKKGSDNPDSLGLGLSIVKRICTEHQFDIKYTRADEQHCFTVSW